MVYIIGFLGFIAGFALGLLILNRLLRHRPASELMNNKSLQLRYGLFNWLIAGLCAYCAVWLYNLYS